MLKPDHKDALIDYFTWYLVFKLGSFWWRRLQLPSLVAPCNPSTPHGET